MYKLMTLLTVLFLSQIIYASAPLSLEEVSSPKNLCKQNQYFLSDYDGFEVVSCINGEVELSLSTSFQSIPTVYKAKYTTDSHVCTYRIIKVFANKFTDPQTGAIYLSKAGWTTSGYPSCISLPK